LSEDDGRGVAEALSEEQFGQGLVARGKHLMYLANLTEAPTPVAKQRRWSRDNLVLYPWAFFTSTSLSESEWAGNYSTSVFSIKFSIWTARFENYSFFAVLWPSEEFSRKCQSVDSGAVEQRQRYFGAIRALLRAE
jgi:hypothetical protein